MVRLDLRRPIAAVTNILSLITVTDGHDGGLCDSECTSRGAIDGASVYADSVICFAVTARSILLGVLPNAYLSGQSVRRNYRDPSSVEEVFKPCAIHL